MTRNSENYRLVVDEDAFELCGCGTMRDGYELRFGAQGFYFEAKTKEAPRIWKLAYPLNRSLLSFQKILHAFNTGSQYCEIDEPSWIAEDVILLKDTY